MTSLEKAKEIVEEFKKGNDCEVSERYNACECDCDEYYSYKFDLDERHELIVSIYYDEDYNEKYVETTLFEDFDKAIASSVFSR